MKNPEMNGAPSALKGEAQKASSMPSPKQSWQTPEVVLHGEIADLTTGINLNPGDGFSNLT